VPALPSSVREALWVQIAAPLATRQDTHPPGCHRPRIPDRVVFDKRIQVLVFGCGYRRLADHSCSATTLRRRRDAWISAGVAEQLRRAALGAYDRLFGLELEHLAVDGCITKSPRGGQVAGPSPVDRRKQGGNGRSSPTRAPFRWRRRPPRPSAATTGCWPPPWAPSGCSACCPAAHRAPDAGYDYQPCRQVLSERAWSARSPHVASPHRCRPAAAGPWRAPRVGQPVRQAALVHRTPPAGGRVLAGAGHCRRRLRPAAPPRLRLLSLGQPTPPPPITYWRRS
jgi:hypothetical protein